MEVPGLGVESELQLPAYITATAMPDPTCVFDLHHSSWQRQILNPLSKARDWTYILMDTSRVCNLLSYNEKYSTCTFLVGMKFATDTVENIMEAP